MQCSICLDDLEGGPTLACGHRFHAACLARLAGANGTTPTRRGALTACPNCRTVSRVAISTPAAFAVGDRVEALWGQRWYPGVVDAVLDGGRAYEIVFDDGDEGEVRAAHVRAAPAPARMARRTGAVVTPREAPPVAAPPPALLLRAPTPSTRRAHTRSSGPPPAPRVVRVAPARPPARTGHVPANANTYPCPASCGCGLRHRRCGACAACRRKLGDACLTPVPDARVPPPAPAALPPATRSHVASTSSAWIAVCTDLLDALKDRTNMRGLREPLVSRGFICGLEHPRDGRFTVAVPPDFPCYYDLVGKDYASSSHGHAQSLPGLRKYLEGALALARAGDAYRTDAEYKARASTRVSAKTSRFTGVYWHRKGGKWHAQITLRRSTISLGSFDDEEDAARAFDAALVKYKGKPTVNFPGEAPLASVLAALPAAPAAAPRRSGRAPARKVIVDAPDERKPSLKRRAKHQKKRETGMHGGKRVEGAIQKANGKWTNTYLFPGRDFDDLDEYRAAKRQRAEQRTEETGMHVGRTVEGAYQKENGKWANPVMFPGREFDDLDAYRAAKKQHAARRAAYSAQTNTKYKK